MCNWPSHGQAYLMICKMFSPRTGIFPDLSLVWGCWLVEIWALQIPISLELHLLILKKKVWGYFSGWFLWLGCGSVTSLKDRGPGLFPWEEAIPSFLYNSTLSIHKGPSQLCFLGESPGDATAAMLPGVPKVKRSRVSFLQKDTPINEIELKNPPPPNP